jgi:hypothetical protein
MRRRPRPRQPQITDASRPGQSQSARRPARPARRALLRESCHSHEQCPRARPDRRPPSSLRRTQPSCSSTTSPNSSPPSARWTRRSWSRTPSRRSGSSKPSASPVVHSTVNLASIREQPTLPELAGLLTDDKPLDQTTINAWEDIEFVQAIHATGRRKLIFCALWTEMCMARCRPRRAARRLRGLPRHRRNRRHLPRSPPGRPRPRHPGRRPPGHLGRTRRPNFCATGPARKPPPPPRPSSPTRWRRSNNGPRAAPDGMVPQRQ